MFTGFASENTPAIQVIDCFMSSVAPSIGLVGDCAPIQFVRTGGNTTDINIYLPTAPIEGKQIKIINSRYGSSNQKIYVFASDSNGNGTNSIVAYIGAGQTIDFCYLKNCISYGVSQGKSATGWVALNQSNVTSASAHSVVSGGLNNCCSLTSSFIGSGQNNTVNSNYSAIIGGDSNTTSGTNSIILGGNSNTAGGNNAVVVGGGSNNASGSGSENAILGGISNTNNAIRSAIVAGQSNTVNSNCDYGLVLSGFSNTSSSVYGTVINGAYGTTRGIIGNTVLPASGRPIAASIGVTQSAILVLGRQTTDATATVLASNNSAATTTNQVILPNNSAYYFRGECIAGVTGGGDTKGWYIEGVIKRGANAATTAIVGTATVTSNYADAGASTWSVTATADTTNGGLAITVTGQAATTIRWVCQIRTTEMTF